MRPGSASASVRELRRIRWQSSPRYRAATAVALCAEAPMLMPCTPTKPLVMHTPLGLQLRRCRLAVVCWHALIEALHGPHCGWCSAAHLQWLDWMPPMVTTQSWPCALTSAIRNSSFLT